MLGGGGFRFELDDDSVAVMLKDVCLFVCLLVCLFGWLVGWDG